MARIKKQGLDYFPLDTDFMKQRTVRRLMKLQGDRAFTVLLSALSAIYGGEGYYVHIDDAFCEDLATDLYDTDARQVKDILQTAITLGLFDERLYREYGILTSATTCNANRTKQSTAKQSTAKQRKSPPQGFP